MTDNTSLVNLALQAFGSRTTVTSAELVANSTNEAIQANITFENTRDSLLRLAPWDCGMKTANLVYITSVPGTMENTSPAPALWQPGLPRPPWAYEYQYPVDCLKACWIIPASQTGFTGVPITTAITGNTPTTWLGGPIVFKVGIDQFFPVIGQTIVAPGTGYSVNDLLTFPIGPATSSPVGAPAQVLVTAVDGSGGITTVTLVNVIAGSATPIGGSYFSPTAGTLSPTGGGGTGATFTLSYTAPKIDQRVILTNQEFATLCYVRQVTDPNVWDPMFQDAFTNALGADLCMALSGDKTLANMCRQEANKVIAEARKADANEGLTINDVVPDWIRIRGVDFDNQYLNQNNGFDWGGMLPLWN